MYIKLQPDQFITRYIYDKNEKIKQSEDLAASKEDNVELAKKLLGMKEYLYHISIY